MIVMSCMACFSSSYADIFNSYLCPFQSSIWFYVSGMRVVSCSFSNLKNVRREGGYEYAYHWSLSMEIVRGL